MMDIEKDIVKIYCTTRTSALIEEVIRLIVVNLIVVFVLPTICNERQRSTFR